MKLLYVDILNFSRSFFPSRIPHHHLRTPIKLIQRFIKAANASGFEIVVFIDAVQTSKEAIQKYVSRRTKEVIKGKHNMPEGLEALLADSFRANGVKVFYSTNVDNDDAVAAFAHHNKGAIFSQDNDFFRYNGANYPVYKAFKVNKNRLILDPTIGNPKRISDISTREILDALPEVTESNPRLISVFLNSQYRRGTGSILIKELGNPHLIARPLRQALYARLGITKPVVEIFPIWQDNAVHWTENQVLADNKLDYYLDNPVDAHKYMFPLTNMPSSIALEQWGKHQFSTKSIIYELCVMANPTKYTLLQLLLNAFENNMTLDDILASDFNGLMQKNKQFVHKFTCSVCARESGLTQRDLNFYISKDFKMPRKCKDCRKAIVK